MANRIERWLRPSTGSTPLAVRFGRVYDLQVQSGSDYAVPEHVHETWEVMLIESGCYACVLNGVALELPAPAMLLVKPGDRHADRVRGPASFISAVLRSFPIGSRTGIGPVLATDTPAQAQACTVERNGSFAITMRDILREAIQAEALSPWLLDALAGALFWRALALVPPAHHALWLLRARQASALSIRLRMQVEQDLAHPPSVDELAKRVGLSGRVLRLHCERELGDSPARFIARLRIERARLLLAMPGATVKAVADQLGFATQAHFARVYRRFVGHPPSDDTGIA